MKKKKTISGLKIVFIFLLVFLLVYTFHSTAPKELKFKITKEVCEDLIIKNISKQDLTTEWLDENAECVESTCQGDSFEYKERCYEDIDYGKCLEKIENKEFGNKNSLMCASDGGKITLKSCSKYELGNYTIEVLK